jgi:hypothetical protein
VIWKADAKLSVMEKKLRAFGSFCGFYRVNGLGCEFLFFALFWLSLIKRSGRIYEPNYNKWA